MSGSVPVRYRSPDEGRASTACGPAADELAPDPGGVLEGPRSFFRRGSSGAARDILSRGDLDHYEERTAPLAPPDLLAWLHRGDAGSSGWVRAVGQVPFRAST